jgi:hypothetical protein
MLNQDSRQTNYISLKVGSASTLSVYMLYIVLHALLHMDVVTPQLGAVGCIGSNPTQLNFIGVQNVRRDVTKVLLLPSLRRHPLTNYKVAASVQKTFGEKVCYHSIVFWVHNHITLIQTPSKLHRKIFNMS